MNRWPLVLRHADAARIVKQHTTQLILTREIKPHDSYEIHDALIVRRNERHRKHARWELQQDPTIATITVVETTETTLLELNLKIVRAAGFNTQRDFYDDWLQRRRHIDPQLTVYVCAYQPADVPRLLHRRVHRGYTTDPAQAAHGEPEALTPVELKRLAGAANRRYEREHREQVRRQQVRSIKARMSDADREGNADQFAALSHELARLADEMRAA